MSKKIVFYDKMDNDGRGARAVFELAHEKEDVLYIGLDRDMKDNDAVHYLNFLMAYTESDLSTVFFLDLAPRTEDEAEMLKSMASGYCGVVIIDHHKLNYNPKHYGFGYIYKDGVSACMLTWGHFNKGKSAPYVVELINDRDVWINNMQPQTNYFHSVSEMMNQQELFNVIVDGTFPNENNDLKKWLHVGEIREKSNQSEIKHELENMKFGTLFGVNIALMEGEINYDILSQLGNEACNVFKDRVDAYCHVRQKSDGRWSYSLRSLSGQAKKIITNNDLDGGGHDNACGFKDERYLISKVGATDDKNKK